MSQDYKKIDDYIAKGDFWRAKESLQGRLSSSKYDAVLFEKYGKVLLEMKDILEAGKYLFLSGSRKPEYENSIQIYLNRFSRKSAIHLYHTFPKAVQSSEYQTYPRIVIDELNQIGFKPKEVKEIVKSRTDVGTEMTFLGKVGAITLVIMFLGIIVGVIVQGARGVHWLWGWFTN